MNKIELIHTGGPYGDCTDNFDVITDASTLGELITALLGRDNFQTFCIRANEKKWTPEDLCIAYAKDGKITRKACFYEDMLPMKLKKVTVNGGWGNMTYDIWVEGELPKQERKEYEMVYWGYTFKS